MTVVGAFYGAGDPIVAAGKYLLHLQINTIDRLNLSTASWTVTATGKSYTATADASGRADILVDSGYTYTVEMTHDGEYYNDGAQTVIATSRGSGWVYFDLFKYPELTTVVQVTTKSAGVVVTATCGSNSTTATSDSNCIAEFLDLPAGTTWSFSAGGQTRTATIEHLLTTVDLSQWCYGIKFSRTASTPGVYTYTDDAVGMTPASGHDLGEWGDTDVFKDCKPIMKNGDVWTDLMKTDLTKDTEGNTVDITTLGHDVFAEIPIHWLSITTDGSYDIVRVSSEQKDSTFVKLADLWQGSHMGLAHVGAFHGYNSSSKLYSSANRSPTVSVSIANFITYAQARGTGYDIVVWHVRNYINAIMMLAYATRDLQSAIGKGYVSKSALTAENLTSFDNEFGIAGDTSAGTSQMAFLWITNWWGNILEFVGGAQTDANCQLMTLDNGEKSSVSTSGFVTHSTTLTSSRGGYVSEMDCTETAVGFFPKVCSGSSTTFWCDNGSVYASYFPYCGGSWSSGDSAGPFNVYFYYSSSNTYSNIGSRLSYRAGRTA